MMPMSVCLSVRPSVCLSSCTETTKPINVKIQVNVGTMEVDYQQYYDSFLNSRWWTDAILEKTSFLAISRQRSCPIFAKVCIKELNSESNDGRMSKGSNFNKFKMADDCHLENSV